MSWLQRLFKKRQLDRELDAELKFHFERQVADNIRAGMSESEARRDARLSFGGMEQVKEDCREARGTACIEDIVRDLRLALRMMRRRPVFTAVAVLSLAIGLGANTAVFSFVNAIVLKRLPAPGSERFVILRMHNETFHIENCCFTFSFFDELRKQATYFEEILTVFTSNVNFTDRGQTERLTAEVVSGNYFKMLGVRAFAGRLIEESDDGAEGASPVCVISHRLWQERFGGRMDVIGRRVLINENPFQIIGVTEPGFVGASLHESHDLQIPASMQAATYIERPNFTPLSHQLIARLQPGTGLEQAEARLNVIGWDVYEKTVGQRMSERDAFLLRDGSQGLSSRKRLFGIPSLILLLLVGVVLLAACANLAALLLVRSVESTREAGLRIALGASKSALFRRFLLESLMLAVAGGAAGWMLARLLIQVLLSLLGTQGEGLLTHVRPDVSVFAFSAAAALVAGILFGVLPAWRAANTNPLDAVRGVVTSRRGRRPILSNLVVTGQIALSIVLLFCAGLFTQTLGNLRSIDLGFRPENLVLLRLDISQTTHRGSGAMQFFEELLRQARQQPSIRAASLSGISVLSGSMSSTGIKIPGYVSPNGLDPVTNRITVSDGYFRTLGAPLLAGRDFTGQELTSGAGSVIVNEQFARQFFSGDALGKTFESHGSVRIVGIAGNTKYRWLREDVQPIMYVPATKDRYPQAFYLQLRSTQVPGAGHRASTHASKKSGFLGGYKPHNYNGDADRPGAFP